MVIIIIIIIIIITIIIIVITVTVTVIIIVIVIVTRFCYSFGVKINAVNYRRAETFLFHWRIFLLR